MPFIINPGSQPIVEKGKGWTNTYETAVSNAKKFMGYSVKEGLTDLKMVSTHEERDGRWVFIIKHLVTGKEVELEIDGIDNLDEYKKEYIFGTRTYWNGSSCSGPSLEDFFIEGFKPIMTYKEVDGKS